jgi:hypothetical protein
MILKRVEETDEEALRNILDELITKIEKSEKRNSEEETSSKEDNGEMSTRSSSRRKRSAQELWDIDSSNILSKKRVVGPLNLRAHQQSPLNERSLRLGPNRPMPSSSLPSLTSNRDEYEASKQQPTRVSARLRKVAPSINEDSENESSKSRHETTLEIKHEEIERNQEHENLDDGRFTN